MRVFIITIFVLIFSGLTANALSVSNKKMIRVAVIDTGIDLEDNNVTLCDSGHKDFSHTSLKDTKGHGSNISHIIERYAKGASYCQVIIKYWVKQEDPKNIFNFDKALEYALTQDVQVINVSAGGYDKTLEEEKIVKKVLDKGIIIVNAAGNDGKDLDKKCNWYPGCYDPRIIMVGNVVRSNYGKVVKYIENGVDVFAGGYIMTGSSQACAIRTGKLIKELSEK